MLNRSFFRLALDYSRWALLTRARSRFRAYRRRRTLDLRAARTRARRALATGLAALAAVENYGLGFRD